MTAFNTPPGVTQTEDTVSIGSPNVLVPHPDTPTSFAFTSPGGETQSENESIQFTGVPTTGQIWPRSRTTIIEAGVEPTRQIIAGTGLTGGGDLSTDVTLNVGAGTGITVNANDITLNTTYTDGRYFQLTTVDAKGDLLVATANDTLGKLSIGTDGYVLTADSAQTSGVKWAAAAAGGGSVEEVYIGTSTPVDSAIELWIDTDAISVNAGAVPETRSILAGAGLTGGGDLTADRSLDIGAGTGITVAADAVSVDTTVIATRTYVDTYTPTPTTSGLWQPMFPYGSLSTNNINAGGIKLTRVVLRNSVKDVIVEVTTLGTGAIFRVGVWADTSMAPGALVTQSGDMSGAATGMITGTLGSTVTAGTYWIGIQNTGSTGVTFRATGGHNPFLPGQDTPTSASQNNSWLVSGQGSTLPNPFPGSPTRTGLQPHVWLKSV